MHKLRPRWRGNRYVAVTLRRDEPEMGHMIGDLALIVLHLHATELILELCLG